MASQLRKGTVQLKVLRTEKRISVMLFLLHRLAQTVYTLNVYGAMQKINKKEPIIISDSVYTGCPIIVITISG